MAVVRPERNSPIRSTALPTPRLLGQQRSHHRNHVYVAVQVAYSAGLKHQPVLDL